MDNIWPNVSICGIVTSHHPDRTALDNMSRIAAEVQGLVIVDNGSTTSERAILKDVAQSLGCDLIENDENQGIAEALNQGARWARSKGYDWVALFDQDSTVTEGFVAQMFATWRSHPDRGRVASIHPRYVDPATGIEALVRRAADGGPMVSLTSGALLPTWIFDKIGWFASDYFIDCVDYEYCLRIRSAGYTIAESRESVLLHSAGNARRTIRFFGFSFRPTFHSPQRRYYMSRNRIVLYRAYFRKYPGWVLRSAAESIRDTIKCLIAEPDRARKLQSFILGTWHGIIGKMGKFLEP